MAASHEPEGAGMTAKTQRLGASDAEPELLRGSDKNADFLPNGKRQGKSARHAEIGRRHRRKWPAQSKLGRIKSVRRKQVLRLLRDRHGGAILPDDTAAAPPSNCCSSTVRQPKPWRPGPMVKRSST